MDLDQKGDRRRWERSWEVSGTQLNQEKLSGVLDKALSRGWTRTGRSSDTSGQRTSWAFKGDDGRPWKGLATIGSPRDAADHFLVTVAVERASKN